MLEQEGAEARPPEIAVLAGWFGRLAHTPSLLLLVACPGHGGIIGRGTSESRLACGENSAISGSFQTCRNLPVLHGFSAALPARATPVESLTGMTAARPRSAAPPGRYPQPGRGRRPHPRAARRSSSASRRRSGRPSRRERSRRSPRPCSPWSTSRPSSSSMSSANASPADGPPTPPASILTLTGSLIVDGLSRAETPMIARFGSCGSATVLIVDRPSRSPSRHERERDRVAGLVLGEQPRAGRRRRGRACRRRRRSRRSAAASRPRARSARRATIDHAAGGSALDLVAEVLERDRRGDLLRVGHLLQRPMLLLGRSRRA